MKIGAYILWALIAGISGLIVLLGYFFPVPALEGPRRVLMGWGVLLAAGAVFLGLFNLFQVHWNRVDRQASGWAYSGVLIFFLVVTLAMGLFFGPDFEIMILLFEYIQVPVEAALLALLAVALVVAGFRLVSRRRDLFSVVFVATSVLILIGNSPWVLASDSAIAHLLGNVRAWVGQVWAAGGARGLLLGVALGAAATGARVLMGVDRPYGD